MTTTANANGVRADILAKWDHWSGNGVPIDVQVHENVVSGNSAPGNAGYDQILLGDKEHHAVRRCQRHDADGDHQLRHGRGGLERFDPRVRARGGASHGAPRSLHGLPAAARQLVEAGGRRFRVSIPISSRARGPTYPQFTHAEIISMLGLPSNARITVPLPGHEDDIMGHSDRLPLQSDLNALAARGRTRGRHSRGPGIHEQGRHGAEPHDHARNHMFIPRPSAHD